MINKKTASVFNCIDQYFGLFHGYGRATKTAAHIFSPSPVIVPDVLRAMHHDPSPFSFIIEAGLESC
jgi:hypothetical protein